LALAITLPALGGDGVITGAAFAEATFAGAAELF
jgi:hypothetical protein